MFSKKAIVISTAAGSGAKKAAKSVANALFYWGIHYRIIRKDRFCLSENGLYYNIDIYPQWKDQALMEIELYSADDSVRFPEGIRVIREVSGEEEFTNPYIARNSH